MTKRQKIWDVLFPMVFILLCMAAVTVIMLLVSGLLVGEYDPERIYEKARTLPMWISIVTFTLTLFLQRQNYQVDSMRFPLRNVGWTAIDRILACVCVTFAGNVWSSLITRSGLEQVFTGYVRNAAPAFENQNLMLLIIGTVILGPMAEEMIFRGMLYRRAAFYAGTKAGVVISALCFGVYHGNAIQFLYAFGLGFLLTFLYERSGDLRVSIAAHMSVNAWAVLGDPLIRKDFNGSVPIYCLVAEAVAAVLCFVVLAFRTKQESGLK